MCRPAHCSIIFVLRKGKEKNSFLFFPSHCNTVIKSPHTHTKKSTNKKCWWGCGEKETLMHCWWECKLGQPLWGTVWRFLKKVKMELLYDPAIPLLGIYSGKPKILIRKDTCSPMFIAAIFTIAETWKPSTSPSICERMKKMQHIYTPHLLNLYIKYSTMIWIKFCHLQQYGWT